MILKTFYPFIRYPQKIFFWLTITSKNYLCVTRNLLILLKQMFKMSSLGFHTKIMTRLKRISNRFKNFGDHLTELRPGKRFKGSDISINVIKFYKFSISGIPIERNLKERDLEILPAIR